MNQEEEEGDDYDDVVSTRAIESLRILLDLIFRFIEWSLVLSNTSLLTLVLYDCVPIGC